MKYNTNKEIKPKIFDEKRLMSYSIWLLSKRDYSEFEIKEKMKKYQPDEKIISSVCTKLVQMSYINDERRANSIFNQYIRKEGIKKISYRLKQKGIEQDLIEQIISNKTSEDDFQENLNTKIQQLLINKYKTFNPDNYQKYASFLASRGYAWKDISEAISEFKKISQTDNL